MRAVQLYTDKSPKGEGHGFALYLALYPAQPLDEMKDVIVLADGYVTEKQALSALFECLTFSPPDLTIYDEAISQVSNILDRAAALEEAMTQVGDRLNSLEEFRDSLTPPEPQGRSPLLRRPAAPPPQRPAQRQPAPSIRRPAPKITIGMQTTGQAGPGMEISGGAFRPGAGGEPPEE